MYFIRIERAVVKYLITVPPVDYFRIKKKIQNLGIEPRPFGSIKLKGRNSFRVRQGDYRIIYEIHDNDLIIIIISIGHRKDIYQK
jgi:mRNA interferase RelE/StbE